MASPPPKKKNPIPLGLILFPFVVLFGACGVCVIVGSVSKPSSNARAESAPARPPLKESALFADARVECRGALGPGLSCSVESKGRGAAKACWDAVLVCGGDTHVGHQCSGLVPPGSTESYAVTNFVPALSPGEPCTSMRVEHVALQ